MNASSEFSAAEKRAVRPAALGARDALTASERAEASEAVCRYLSELAELKEAGTVLGYAAFGSECDLSALYDALRASGVAVAFPVTAEDGTMEAFVPSGPLVRGRFGVPEPDPAASRRLAPDVLDVVLVPCVAFDGSLRRLGHGAGCYDRYLPRCAGAKAVLIGFEAQRLDAVPIESHDLSFSVLATEKGVFRL